MFLEGTTGCDTCCLELEQAHRPPWTAALGTTVALAKAVLPLLHDTSVFSLPVIHWGSAKMVH